MKKIKEQLLSTSASNLNKKSEDVRQTKISDIRVESPSLEIHMNSSHMEVIRKSIGTILCKAIDEITSTSPEKCSKIDSVTVKARYVLAPEEVELSLTLKR